MSTRFIYIPRDYLIKAAGKKFEEVLDSLKREGLLEAYEAAYRLEFDSAKAQHIESILEFYDISKASLTIKSKKDK